MDAVLTRREFLARATSTAAAVALAGRGTAARAGMWVSLNGSVTRTMEWTEFARLASRVGYGGIDWGFAGPRAIGVDATRALLAELKIKPTVVNLPVRFAGNDANYQADLPGLDEAAKFSAAIGCPRMMAVLSPGSATPKAEQRKIVKDRLAAISEILLRSNIRLGLEFLGPLYFRTKQPHEFIYRMDETVELAKECGPNIGVVLDAWHWYHAGGTTADILAAGKSRIVQVHVSDAKQTPPEDVRDNQRLMPGEGIIDLIGFFRSLQKIGYEDGVRDRKSVV